MFDPKQLLIEAGVIDDGNPEALTLVENHFTSYGHHLRSDIYEWLANTSHFETPLTLSEVGALIQKKLDDSTLDALKGQKVVSATANRGWDQNRITLTFESGSVYEQYHERSCCERVEINDINPDLDHIIGGHLSSIEEESSKKWNPKEGDSHTWTYYKIRTSKGSVDIRWYGSSNGYYSERVDEFVNGRRIYRN
jgi:hypothetical protein